MWSSMRSAVLYKKREKKERKIGVSWHPNNNQNIPGRKFKKTYETDDDGERKQRNEGFLIMIT
jgi:hypothetical protein